MKQQHRSCHKHAISHAYHADPLSHSCYHHLIICPPPCPSNPSRVNVVKKANNGATLGSRKLPHRVPPLLAGWPSMMAARTNRTWSHLELWSGSRADPRSLRGAEMARYPAPATDRVRKCTSVQRHMQWEAMTRIWDAGWVAGVTYRISRCAVKIWLKLRASDAARAAARHVGSDGTETQADSWMTPISSVHHMAHASGP